MTLSVRFYLDTGAEVNVINKETHERIGAPTLKRAMKWSARMMGEQQPSWEKVGLNSSAAHFGPKSRFMSLHEAHSTC
jgi:hypothetical protein